jgi:hypothetical protein
MRRRYLTGWILVLALFLFKPSSAFAQTTITFDDLTDNGGGTVIANGYHGLNWSNFYVVNTADYYASQGTNGYTNGTVSGPNVAFNAYGTPASFLVVISPSRAPILRVLGTTVS